MFPPRPQGEDSASIPPPHLLPLLPPTSVRSKNFFTSKLLRSSKRPSSKVPPPSLSVFSVCSSPADASGPRLNKLLGCGRSGLSGEGGVGRGGEGGSFWTGPSVLAPFTSPTAVKLHRSNQRPSALQMCEEPLLDLPGVAGSFYSLWWKNICRVLMWLDPGFILRPGSRRSQASCKSSLGFCFWQQR